MAIDLQCLSDRQLAPTNIRVQRVNDHETLYTWCRVGVSSVGLPDLIVKPLFDMVAWRGFGPDVSFHHYLAWLDDQPVATARLLRQAGIAGIYNVATIPEARRRGAGTTVTLTALQDACAFGYRIGVLLASKMGAPMYHQLGFQEYCQIDNYIWQPQEIVSRANIRVDRLSSGSAFTMPLKEERYLLLTITVDNQHYTHVCGDRLNGRAVYRGAGKYMRIGLPAIIAHEASRQRHLWGAGFPIASLLETGEVDGHSFFVEAALGESVLGEIFESETQEHGTVTDASFRSLLMVVLRWAEAQLQHVATPGTPPDLAYTVRLTDIERLLPDLIPLTRQVFLRLQQRFTGFPTVLTHGDFHPHNICTGGVIDLEFVHWSVAGYDIINAFFGEGLWPIDLTDFRFTQMQQTLASHAIDELFHAHHLPLPLAYMADFLMCRMMRMVELRGHRPSAVNQWIYQGYEAQAKAYAESTIR